MNAVCHSLRHAAQGAPLSKRRACDALTPNAAAWKAALLGLPRRRSRLCSRLATTLVLALGFGAAGILPAAAAPGAGVFGSSERNTSALIGIFYDLKQTQQRAPADGSKRFAAIVDEFVVSGFDEALLNNYYRAPLPLYTTQIAMHRMSAEEAPKAFGVEDEVKPRAWIVHYKAQVAPPEDGTYRFLGRADDMMIVAINRKVVLNGSLGSTKLPKLNWTSPEPKGAPLAGHRSAVYGDWIELKADQPVDLDILVGERPGGIFNALLFYQKQGEAYPSLGGKPVVPLFQVAEQKEDKREYLTDRPVWRCLE